MTIALSAQEDVLRRRILRAGDAIPDESWTTDELRLLADFLESVVNARRRVDTIGNVAWIADHRPG